MINDSLQLIVYEELKIQALRVLIIIISLILGKTYFWLLKKHAV